MKNRFILFTFILIPLFFMKVGAKPIEEVELQSFTNIGPVTYFDSPQLNVTIPSEPQVTKSLFKAAYISTYKNKDMEQLLENSLSIPEFKQEYMNILDLLKDNHFNVIIFEVRPLSDAYYSSNLNPTSKFLIGQEGSSLTWDPLAWMIEEAHHRDMEFHSWINPFLVSDIVINETNTVDSVIATLDDKNFAKVNPEYLIIGQDKKLYLNPGEAVVKSFLVETVNELISGYPVDAIHIKNTFYPQDGMNLEYDAHLIEKTELNVTEFRTKQVNEVVKRIYNNIKDYNIQNDRSVQFGLTYDTQFPGYIDLNYMLNTIKIDYLIANIHYQFDEAQKGYADYVQEWSEYMMDSSTNLYIGLNIDIESDEYEREILSQLLYIQKYNNIKGIAFNQFMSVYRNNEYKYNTINLITNRLFEKSLLLPAVENVYVRPADHTLSLKVTLDQSTVNLTWETVPHAKSYIVYRFTNATDFQLVELSNPDNIIAIIKNDPDQITLSYLDEVDIGNRYKYFISIIDFANNETDIPTQRDIDLTFEQDLEQMLILFGLLSIITISIIGFSSYKVLKQ